MALGCLPWVYIERDGVSSQYRFCESKVERIVMVSSLVKFFVRSAVVKFCKHREM